MSTQHLEETLVTEKGSLVRVDFVTSCLNGRVKRGGMHPGRCEQDVLGAGRGQGRLISCQIWYLNSSRTTLFWESKAGHFKLVVGEEFQGCWMLMIFGLVASLGLKWWKAGMFALESVQCKKLPIPPSPALLPALPSHVPLWVMWDGEPATQR